MSDPFSQRHAIALAPIADCTSHVCFQNGTIEVWTKQLSTNFEQTYASVILNRGASGRPTNVSFVLREFGIHDLMGFWNVQDVFEDTMTYFVATDDVYHVVVDPSGVVLLQFYPTR